MSVRNLDRLFSPRSVALIGASNRDRAVGFVTLKNLVGSGFQGPVWPVNPKHDEIDGLKAYPNIAALPDAPDLAVICTPAAAIPALISELGTKGTRAAIVITGSGAGGDTGRDLLHKNILEAAQPHLLRILGPNSVGTLSPDAHLNASFAQRSADQGNIALVTQSGAVLTTVLDWAGGRNIGFSHLISLGDAIDIDFADMLDFLASDRNTKSVILYIEAITNARKFMSAARACARIKPVIVIKAGRHAAAAQAAKSHTGALAGADDVYDAAFRRAGLLRVLTLEEIFDAIETLSSNNMPAGNRMAIITNGGGIGVLATDALLDQDGVLAKLSDSTHTALDAFLPTQWSHGNPLDIIGDADPARYANTLSLTLTDPNVDLVLVIHCPVAVASAQDCAQAVIDVAAKSHLPVLTNWLGDPAVKTAREMFRAAHIPTYTTPDDAIKGAMYLIQHHLAQESLMEVPAQQSPEFTPDRDAAAKIIKENLQTKTQWLGPKDVFALLSAYGIPIVHNEEVSSAEDARECAATFKNPVALKVISPDILHKSDSGGVVLNLATPQTVFDATRAMQAHLATHLPTARIEGFLLQEMISRPHAFELIIGMSVDATFGPVILVGRGGVAVEVVNDKALALPPLNLVLARQTIARTRVYRELQGYRDRPAANLDEIAHTLVKLSQLISDHSEITELDINPLLVDENGVIAVDARVRIQPSHSGEKNGGRLAITPYPHALATKVTIAGAGAFDLRPVKPEDSAAFMQFSSELTREDMRLRFMSPKHRLQPQEIVRLTQIDYDREMAFVLLESKTRIAGVVRLVSGPNQEEAEFAVIVRSDLKEHGIGHFLLSHIIAYARNRGIKKIFGEVLAHNHRMLELSRVLGFNLKHMSDAPGTVRAELSLEK